jgi:hypothetical protein
MHQLVTELRNALVAATTFCSGHGVALAELEQIADGMTRLQAVTHAVIALISPIRYGATSLAMSAWWRRSTRQ